MSELTVYIRSKLFFGDQIVAFPTLYQLKQWWPDKKLTVVAQDPVAHYYENLPWVDGFVHSQSFMDNYRAVSRRTHLMVALHYTSEQYGLISTLKRPKIRLGFHNKRASDLIAWTHSVPRNTYEYQGLANMNLLSTYRPLDAEQTVRACFTTLAAMAGTPPQTSDVVLMPGGGAGAFKRWSLQNYISLADLLKQEMGADTTFSFVLGPDEQAESAQLQQLARPDFRLFMSRSIAEIAYLTTRARLVVANDCGPSHIGQGACVPYVGIFHEPNPMWIWARDYRASVTPTPEHTRIINSIPPQIVLQSCLKVLQASGSAPSGF